MRAEVAERTGDAELRVSVAGEGEPETATPMGLFAHFVLIRAPDATNEITRQFDEKQIEPLGATEG